MSKKKKIILSTILSILLPLQFYMEYYFTLVFSKDL